MPPPTRFAGTPRFRAPTGNGEVLAAPDFAAVPGLVDANRRLLDRSDVMLGGLPLRELRALARREVLELANGPASAGRGADAPLILAGHQPELSHPGVWVKHFAINGLARRLGGTPLNLVVDNDTLKSTALRFPVYDRDPRGVRLQALRFDTFSGDMPYEDRRVEDSEHTCLFDSFADRAAPLWHTWGYEPLLPSVWSDVDSHNPNTPIGERFAEARRWYERAWGCHNLELPVSRLSQTDAFRRFAGHLLADLPRFRAVYNAALHQYREANGLRSANQPAPDLAPGEAPFWVRTATGRREKAIATSDVRSLRPRALTLTLFARVCLGDFFVHGIGGGKYDEVTDVIIRDYFGIDPPAYQVLSATLHLPLPGFPAGEEDVRAAERRVRDLTWNPQRHLPPPAASRPDVAARVRDKNVLAAAEPPTTDHTARKEWFHRLYDLTHQLRPFVADQIADSDTALARCRAEAHANTILRRRDYSWVLYPEETLRPFLQLFLDVP
jgi:hypothetical protein